MCLSILLYHPDLAIEQSEYLGFEYAIVGNPNGYRCGYIKLQPEHPWHSANYDELNDVEVHGNITFSEPDQKCHSNETDNAWWIGFACCECDDAIDSSLIPQEQLNDSSIARFRLDRHSTVKTTEYVRDCIQDLIKQAQLASI